MTLSSIDLESKKKLAWEDAHGAFVGEGWREHHVPIMVVLG